MATPHGHCRQRSFEYDYSTVGPSMLREFGLLKQTLEMDIAFLKKQAIMYGSSGGFWYWANMKSGWYIRDGVYYGTPKAVRTLKKRFKVKDPEFARHCFRVHPKHHLLKEKTKKLVALQRNVQPHTPVAKMLKQPTLMAELVDRNWKDIAKAAQQQRKLAIGYFQTQRFGEAAINFDRFLKICVDILPQGIRKEKQWKERSEMVAEGYFWKGLSQRNRFHLKSAERNSRRALQWIPDHQAAKDLCKDIQNMNYLNQQKRTCAWCGFEAQEKLPMCNGCRGKRFCGRRCQKKHWKESHRFSCPKLSLSNLRL